MCIRDSQYTKDLVERYDILNEEHNFISRLAQLIANTGLDQVDKMDQADKLEKEMIEIIGSLNSSVCSAVEECFDILIGLGVDRHTLWE